MADFLGKILFEEFLAKGLKEFLNEFFGRILRWVPGGVPEVISGWMRGQISEGILGGIPGVIPIGISGGIPGEFFWKTNPEKYPKEFSEEFSEQSRDKLLE